jgi:hypothetical protein
MTSSICFIKRVFPIMFVLAGVLHVLAERLLPLPYAMV